MSLNQGSSAYQNAQFGVLGTQTATEANQSGRSLYDRLLIETAPQGGYYITWPSSVPNTQHIVLAAFSTISEALNFIDNSLRRV